MNKLVEHIINKDYRSAELSLEESFQNIMERKLLEVKKRVAASMCSEDEDKEKDDEDEADEEDKELDEGYTLKKTSVSKDTDDEDGIKSKNTDYDIIHNKSGKSVGTASHSTDDHFGPGSLRINMKNGTTRSLDVRGRDPQSAFNRFLKDPKTSKKYKMEEEKSPHDTRMGRLKNEVLEEDDEDISEAIGNKKTNAEVLKKSGWKVDRAVATGKIWKNTNNPNQYIHTVTIGPGGKSMWYHRHDDDGERSTGRYGFGRGPDNLETHLSKQQKSVSESIDDEDLSEARINIVKARIRGGKIQRRKKVSNVPGMTLRGGKLTRMSPTERRKRKLGARKAARKSRGKKSQMLRKRKLSLMKRSRLGV